MSEYITNKAGARVYKDIKKHSFLKIPELNNEKESGAVYEVFSVGNMGVNFDPVITIRGNDGSAVLCRLPTDLSDWVDYQKGIRLQGIEMFPARIEFGKLNNRIYAEIL